MTNSNLMKKAKHSPNGLKTLWEKEKLLVLSNFSFSQSVFKRLVQQTSKNQGLFGKGLKCMNVKQEHHRPMLGCGCLIFRENSKPKTGITVSKNTDGFLPLLYRFPFRKLTTGHGLKQISLAITEIL